MALLIIGGPTASGKTAAAIHVACLWGAALVGADAMQVYRGLDVGTAKPPQSVLRRYPHGCVDVREIHEEFSVADLVDTVRGTQQAHEHVVVVGGSPFYLAGLLRPMAPMPSADWDLRAELDQIPDPHEALAKVDPDMAASLHPNDRVRVIRALEVHRLTGRPMSVIQQTETPPPVENTLVWLDREDLYERINGRVMRMVDRGYFEEAARVLAAGATGDEKPLKSFAYVHIVGFLRGEIDQEEAIRRTQRDTRRYARKQRTWGRNLGAEISRDRDAVLRSAEQAFGPAPKRF